MDLVAHTLLISKSIDIPENYQDIISQYRF